MVHRSAVLVRRVAAQVGNPEWQTLGCRRALTRWRREQHFCPHQVHCLLARFRFSECDLPATGCVFLTSCSVCGVTFQRPGIVGRRSRISLVYCVRPTLNGGAPGAFSGRASIEHCSCKVAGPVREVPAWTQHCQIEEFACGAVEYQSLLRSTVADSKNTTL